MKANYKVINNKQVQLRKVIEEFKPDDVASVILFRYNVMQALTSLNDDCSDFEEADMKETATDLTEFFEDAVNEAIDSFIDEDKRPNINFNGTADEFREELNNLVVVLLSKNFEHEFIEFSEATGISRVQYEAFAAKFMAEANTDKH